MAFSLSKLFAGTTEAVHTPTSTVGIDIGSASIKVVELEQTDKALTLRTYGEIQLGPYDQKELGSLVELDVKKRTEAVIDVLRESQVSTKHGALALSLSSSFITTIPLAAAPDEDISERIPVEAKKYIPLPLSDVMLDWSELAPLGENTRTREVLLAAIENRALAEYKDILSTIGMTGEPAEIEGFSLVRALGHHRDTTLGIIDLGAKTSKLYIVRGGAIERVHRAPMGGAQITKRTAELLSVSFAEAENIKRSYTKEHPQARDLYRTMASVIESPLQEFKRLINQYEQRTGEPLGRIVLSGGVSASPFLLSYVRDTLGRSDIEIGNSFAKVAYPAFMEDTLKQLAPTFGVSLGAALRLFMWCISACPQSVTSF